MARILAGTIFDQRQEPVPGGGNHEGRETPEREKARRTAVFRGRRCPEGRNSRGIFGYGREFPGFFAVLADFQLDFFGKAYLINPSALSDGRI
jgi:hypothetical protein